MRELIEKGKVETIADGKELVRDVAQLHDKINRDALKISEDIQKVKEDIEKIESCIQKEGAENDLFKIYLVKAAVTLERFQDKYDEKKNECNLYLSSMVTIGGKYGNF